MISKPMGWARRIVVFCALAMGVSNGVGGETEPPPTEDMHLYFDRMARFLSSAQQLRTTIALGYDVLQDSGQKLEFKERHRLTIVRPERMRVEILKSNGERELILFDGKKITVYNEIHAVYAQADKPGNLDQALVYFLRDLEMRMPLALLFNSGFPQEMAQRVEQLTFVERSTLNDTPSVHLAGRTDQVDFQLWIPESGNPLPERLTITYRYEPGQPEFWADFNDWDMAPTTADSDFSFTPPAGSERIPFLVEIDRAQPVTNLKGGD